MKENLNMMPFRAGLITQNTHQICEVGLNNTLHAMDAFAYHRNRQPFIETERSRINNVPTPMNIDIDNNKNNQFNYHNKMLNQYNNGNISKISNNVKERLSHIDWNDSDMRESTKNGYHKNLYNPQDESSKYTFKSDEKCYSKDQYLHENSKYELLSKRTEDGGTIRWNYSVDGIYIETNIMSEQEIIEKMGSQLIRRTKIGIIKMDEISHGMTLKSPENGQKWLVWATREVIDGDYILLVNSVNNCFDKFEIKQFETEYKENDAVLLLSPTGIAAITSRAKAADYFDFGGFTPDVDSLQPRTSNFAMNDVVAYGIEILTNDELINPFTSETILVVATGGGIHSNSYAISKNGSRIQSVTYDYFSKYQLHMPNKPELSCNKRETQTKITILNTLKHTQTITKNKFQTH